MLKVESPDWIWWYRNIDRKELPLSLGAHSICQAILLLILEVATRQRVHILVSWIVLVLVKVDLITLQTDPVRYELLRARFQVTFILHRLKALTHLVEAIKVHRRRLGHWGALKWLFMWDVVRERYVMGGLLRNCSWSVVLISVQTLESNPESRLECNRWAIIIGFSVQSIERFARGISVIRNVILLEDFISCVKVFSIDGWVRHVAHLTARKRVHNRVVAGLAWIS